ncbi:MAG: hypothetical protein QOG08_521 [Chloroflexota bacterium]|nr:hypothetical protein [Chloroflexota bacterium]
MAGRQRPLIHSCLAGLLRFHLVPQSGLDARLGLHTSRREPPRVGRARSGGQLCESSFSVSRNRRTKRSINARFDAALSESRRMPVKPRGSRPGPDSVVTRSLVTLNFAICFLVQRILSPNYSACPALTAFGQRQPASHHTQGRSSPGRAYTSSEAARRSCRVPGKWTLTPGRPGLPISQPAE